MARRTAQAHAEDRDVEIDLDLADYKGTYLECRDLLHSWRIIGFYRSAGWNGTNRSLLCTNCGMEATDKWDGVKVDRRYHQPEGYRIEGRRLSKGEVRQEQMRRSHIYDSEEAMRAALKPSVRRRLHSVA